MGNALGGVHRRIAHLLSVVAAAAAMRRTRSGNFSFSAGMLVCKVSNKLQLLSQLLRHIAKGCFVVISWWTCSDKCPTTMPYRPSFASTSPEVSSTVAFETTWGAMRCEKRSLAVVGCVCNERCNHTKATMKTSNNTIMIMTIMKCLDLVVCELGSIYLNTSIPPCRNDGYDTTIAVVFSLVIAVRGVYLGCLHSV